MEKLPEVVSAILLLSAFAIGIGGTLSWGVTNGRAAMDREFPEALERQKERLPPYVISALENQFNRLNELDLQIDDIEKQLTSCGDHRHGKQAGANGVGNSRSRT